jgi:hypothetical protein
MSKEGSNGHDLETELAELKKRKALLEMHLKENNVALTAAKDARRHALLDASADDVEVYVHRDRTAGLKVIEAMKPLAALPTISPDFFPRMQTLIPEMVIAALQLSKDGRYYAQRIQQGTVPAKKAEPLGPPKKIGDRLSSPMARSCC